MTKSKWNSLPNEILDQIVNKIEDENPVKTKWMIVNKQWFQWYHSVKYKSISIYFTKKNLLKNSLLLQNIIHSKFQPGVYVKSITFKKKLTIASIKQQDLSKLFFSSFVTGANDVGIIYLLMRKCPNVKYVTFPSSIMNQNNWIHFLTALKTCDTWKLHSLSDDHYTIRENDDRCNRSYFNCLYHLRHSLKEITVNYWMVHSESYKLLRHFKQLRKVTVGKNVLHDMNDLCNLGDHLASVDDITVDFSNASPSEAPTSRDMDDPSIIGAFGAAKLKETSLATTSNVTYPNVRKLTMHNLSPGLEETTANFQLIQKFNNVRQLNIEFENALNSSSNVTFLQCSTFGHTISSVASYNITFDVKQDEALFFFKDCCSSLREIMKKSNNNKSRSSRNSSNCINSGQFHLHIQSLPPPKYQIDPQIMKVGISRAADINNGGNVGIYLNFFQSVTQSNVVGKIMKLVFNHKNTVIDKIHYSLQQQDNIGRLLKEYNIISNSTYHNCTKITFTNGTLERDSTTLSQQQEKATITPLDNITHIHFISSFIDPHALPDLSRYLPDLKVIKFNDCKFEEKGTELLENTFGKTIYTNPCFSLPHTDIGTLIISTSKNENALIAKNDILFIMATLTDQDCSKGYICNSSSSKYSNKESTITETNKKTITNLTDMMISNNIDGYFIKVEAKSIQRLLVNLNRKKDDNALQPPTQFNIRIPFSSSL